MKYLTWRRFAEAVVVLATLLFVSACGSATSTGSTQTTTVTYQLQMQFFSHETNLSTVVDPQVFIASPTTPAGTGPQGIMHVVGVKPASAQDPPNTPLLNADAAPLGVTLGAWKAATGSAMLSCRNGQETVINSFQHLLPNAVYSLFVVHFRVNGAQRFTPLGASDGSNNNFTASAAGEGTETSTLSPCLTSDDGVVLIWHSDGHSHGASPGVLGVTWHNHLIFPVS